MKVYLDVPFEEKEEAKKLGAKWDDNTRQWYAPNGEIELINNKKWQINNNPLNLIGEDREYMGNELFVDLIPSTCWFTNVRYCVHPNEWDRLRQHIYSRVNYLCECCGVDSKETGQQLEAHERWEYNIENNTQKLIRLVALCHECHRVTHIGKAQLDGELKEAVKHLQKVRGFTIEDCDNHIQEAYKLWRIRNEREWELDLSLITLNDIKLKIIVNKNERVNIVNKNLNK